MKKLIPIFALCCLAAQAYAAEWMTDLPKALAKAKADKKMVLMDFTGSDWCPPCKALHKNVLTSKEFEAYADTNLVLVVVDFPRQKEQTEELKKANKELAEKYNIQGFPTIVVLDSEGNWVNSTKAEGDPSKEVSADVGYDGESAKDFIAKIDKLKKKDSAADNNQPKTNKGTN